MEKNQIRHIIVAVIASSILLAVLVAGFNLAPTPGIRRLCEMFGGNLPLGFIQYFTYIAFFWAYLEIKERMQHIKYEQKALDMHLLPEQEQWVITPDDVNDLKMQMIEMEQQHKYQLVSIIKKASTKFRSNRSVSEVMDVVSRQINLYMSEAESRQATVRYLGWVIPSLGFIGTVVGIAQSLGLAEKAGDPEAMREITNAMEVAFDTTLVALLLSIPIMWSYHRLQEKEEILYINMENYVMENFVNRINLD